MAGLRKPNRQKASDWVRLATDSISMGQIEPKLNLKQDVRRMDAGETAMLSQQLEQLMAQSFDVVYSPLQARQFLPVRTSTSPGAEVVAYSQFDHVGQALKVTSYADDLPRVNVTQKKFTNNIVPFGAAFEISLQNLRAAMFSGVPLDDHMVRAARRAIEQAINTLALDGDSELAIQGLKDHSGITDTAATTGTWSTATPDQIWADFLQGMQLVVDASDNLFPPNACIIPLARKEYMSQRMTDSDVTIETFIRQNSGMQLFYSHDFDTADSGNPRALFFHRSPETGWIDVAQEYEQLAPQWTNMAYVINCHSRSAGVIIPYRFAFQYLDGV